MTSSRVTITQLFSIPGFLGKDGFQRNVLLWATVKTGSLFTKAMSFPTQPFLAATALALLVATVGAAPPFVPPTEANPPFHRDKLPIDTDSMSSLSRDLEQFSQGANLDDAPQRRAAAQALALALALDPANTSARSSLTAVADGETRAGDSEKLTRAKARIWQSHGWLATPEAGADGQLLADLIGDAAATLDRDHPSAEALRDSERGKWAGWVAPLPAFEESKPVRTELPPEVRRDPPTPEPSATQPARIALSEASVKTVLYAYDKEKDANGFGRTVARMAARVEERVEERVGDEGEGKVWRRPSGLWLDIPCLEGYERDVRDFISAPILRALEASELPLPKDGRIILRAGDGDTYSFRRNTNAISGVGFLLAHAALTGSVPDATVIGVIDSKGRLASPAHIWYYVNALRDGDGGRLVIPADAEEHFLALLTFEEPEFFLKYEVFTASTPKELAELSAKSPGEKQASVSASFQEVRDKAPANSLGSYLANSHVRKRLLEIHAEMPQHLSSKMLALQGSPERPPRTLSRKVLASVIWQAVAPIHSSLDVSPIDINRERIAAMEKAHEEARAAMKRLDRLAERGDADLITRAKSAASDLRSLTRALNSRSADWDTRFLAVSKSFKAAKTSSNRLRRELSEITGDPLSENSLEFIRLQRERFRGQ